MSNAETIKEFLVKLGFKIDEPTFKKFDSAIITSTKSALQLGLVVTAAASATEIFVAKVSASLDKLYFATKRTGSSAENISAFEYAVQQMGGTAEDARASLENLGRFMRTTPGAGGLLTQMLGVKPEHLGDAANSMNDIARTFKALTQAGKQPLVYKLAEMIGIDEKTMLAMQETGRFDDKQREYNKLLRESGVDLENLSRRGMEFTKQLNTLETAFTLLADLLANKLIGPMAWLNQKILDIIGATNAAKNGPQTWADRLGDKLYEMLEPDLAHTPEEWKKIRKGIPLNEDRLALGPAYTAPAIPGMPNNNPGNLRSWGSNPIVNGFAQFPNAMAGLTAMAKQLELYAKRGNDTIAGIVSTYAPASDHNNVPAYIADVVQRTGYGAAQHLNLKDPAVLTSMMNAMVRHENGNNPFETTLIPSIARNVAGGGQSGATLNQNTTINVNGGDNPQGTANSIASVQDRTNSQAIRNLSGAIQ